MLLDIWGTLFVLYLLTIEPFLEGRSIRNFAKSYTSPDARLRLYRSAFIRTWFMGLLLFILCSAGNISSSQLGIRPFTFHFIYTQPWLVKYAIIAFLTWYFIYFYLFGTLIARFKPFHAYFIKKIGPSDSIFPRRSSEYCWWVANSFTACIEELIYRGFIFFFILRLLPNVQIWFVIVISVCIEVMRYIKWPAAIKYVITSGIASCLVYLLFDSLIAAAAMHILYDLKTLLFPFKLIRENNNVRNTA